MSVVEVLREKFNEICEREGKGEGHRELTDEEAETVQTLVFNNTGRFLAFSDVKLLFTSFVEKYQAKKTGLSAARERTQASHV